MIMCLKSLFSVVFGVLRCITTYLSRPRAGIPAVDGGKENDWQTEGWGDFSVTVIPNEKELHQAQDSSCSDLDVFSDMQPVIKRAKTISVQQQQIGPKLNFSVQDEAKQELNVLGDLGNWNEGDLREGWEAELSLDEGHLINETKVAMKEKRMKEREFRRKTQIAVRAQQRTLVGNTSPSLGIKQV